MTGWAATNKLREMLAIAWPEGDHAEPNVFTEALAALALVEAALDTAADIESRVVSGPEWNLGEVFNSAGRLACALRAVREGK